MAIPIRQRASVKQNYALRGALVQVLNAVAIRLQQEIQKALSKRGRSQPGTPPGYGTGRLWRDVQVQRATTSNLTAVVGMAPLKYARIHETGGKITASGKRLAVPLNPTAARMAVAGGGAGLKAVGGLVAVKTKGGSGYDPKGRMLLCRMYGRGKHKMLQPMFILLSSVTLPARPYFWSTIAKSLPAIREEAIRSMRGIAVNLARRMAG